MTTVHLIYPHGDRISCPDAIGRKLAEHLSDAYRVLLYDWTETGVIHPGRGDVLVGHPHPAPWTIFRRSARRPGWRRRLVLAPYNDIAGQVAFLDQSVRHSDLYLAITGGYWFANVPDSRFAHWHPKMVHIDLAVDREDFPVLKTAINNPGERRFLYIGHTALTKNVDYFGAIARSMPEARFAWIGTGAEIEGVQSLGRHDFRTEEAKRLVAQHDFLVSPARADANPATILEGMAWGLLPVCTPESGYVDQPGIVNIPLDNVPAAKEILQTLQHAPERELRLRQDANWGAIDRHFNWDRFADQVADAIESDASPALGSVSARLRGGLALASAVDRRSGRFVLQTVSGQRRRLGRGRWHHGTLHEPGGTRAHALIVEDAICQLRNDPQYVDLIRDAYLDPDVVDAANRFAASPEFAAARRLLGDRLAGSRVLDLGAGRGIASFAFAQSGAELVYALEPDPSQEVGRGAIRALTGDSGLPIHVIDAIGENIPLEDDAVDIVYARQVFHHARDLDAIARECARVLRPGGALLVCREHVVDGPRQLERFLSSHPVHRLSGGEGAYRLEEYARAISSCGLHIERLLGPWDSIINAFPMVRDERELERHPELVLLRRLGRMGSVLARVPGSHALVWRLLRLRRPPGRLFSFLATRPAG